MPSPLPIDRSWVLSRRSSGGHDRQSLHETRRTLPARSQSPNPYPLRSDRYKCALCLIANLLDCIDSTLYALASAQSLKIEANDAER